jgi:hypothetical protein
MAEIPEHLARDVAVLAQADPRTVKRRVRGEKVRPLTAKRIDDALRARGLGELVPKGARK